MRTRLTPSSIKKKRWILVFLCIVVCCLVVLYNGTLSRRWIQGRIRGIRGIRGISPSIGSSSDSSGTKWKGEEDRKEEPELVPHRDDHYDIEGGEEDGVDNYGSDIIGSLFDCQIWSRSAEIYIGELEKLNAQLDCAIHKGGRRPFKFLFAEGFF